jgi:hypothetical protein
MYDGLHALVGKMFLEFVPTIALGDEVHKRMEFVRLFFWQTDRYTFQQFPVEGRVVTSAFNHLVESAKPITQDHGLQRVEPRDITKLGDGISVDEAVVPQ